MPFPGLRLKRHLPSKWRGRQRDIIKRTGNVPSLHTPKDMQSAKRSPSFPESEHSVEYCGRAFTYNSRTGISLEFPALAECETAIKISIKVVNDDYILPEGYENMELVSSMFKITANADLPAPVTVRMEHCAVVEEDDSLVHMIAHGPPPFKFKPLEGGKFPIENNYGEFHTKAFTIFATCASKNGLRLRLSVQLFYHNNTKATFVATKNLSQQILYVKDEFPNAVRVLSQQMSCDYATEAIILIMPQLKKRGGWLVESEFEPAQIEIGDILEYTEGMIPPSIHLRMKWEGEENPVEDSVKIGIMGASLTSFLLDCRPPSLTSPMPSPHHSESCPLSFTQRATPVPQQPPLTPLESQPSISHSNSSLRLRTMSVKPTVQTLRTGQLSKQPYNILFFPLFLYIPCLPSAIILI